MGAARRVTPAKFDVSIVGDITLRLARPDLQQNDLRVGPVLKMVDIATPALKAAQPADELKRKSYRYVMAVERSRAEFWGSGAPHLKAGGFSFHRLAASAPEEEVVLHTHTEAHFVLVLSGGYMSSAAGAPTVSSAPLLVYNPPGTTHRDRFLEGRGTFLAVSGGYEGKDGMAVAVADPFAHRLARGIARSVHAGEQTRFELEAQALQLVAAVTPAGSESAVRAKRPPVWLKAAFELIFISDDPDLSVSDVAVAVGVHRVHLARVFREFLECSPGEVLRGRRLERAAAMLGQPTASLADVAHATGYVDQSHLTRAFRRGLGATPLAWRRRCFTDPRPQD